MTLSVDHPTGSRTNPMYANLSFKLTFRVVQAIVVEDIIWTLTMEVVAVDTQGPKVNTMAGCSRWVDHATMGLKEAALKIWADMDEAVQDRVIPISIKTFLTEVESIWEATIHNRLVQVDQEVTELGS